MPDNLQAEPAAPVEPADTPILVGIVDSGYRDVRASHIEAARGFALAAAGLQAGLPMARVVCIGRDDMTPDPIGHGSAVLDHIARLAPAARFHVAQVFHAHARTSPAQIAAAIDWLIGQRVRVINLSLGLRADRAPLRAACQRATQAGIIVCAASPARGAPVFPASYPDVIQATGDARCRAREWSWLDSAQADFGAAMTGDDDFRSSNAGSAGRANDADRAGNMGNDARIAGGNAGDGARVAGGNAEDGARIAGGNTGDGARITGSNAGSGARIAGGNANDAADNSHRGEAGHAQDTGNGNATNFRTEDLCAASFRTASFHPENARAENLARNASSVPSRSDAPVGASMAAAIMSGHIAAWLARHPQADRSALLAHLRARAAFTGIERRVRAS